MITNVTSFVNSQLSTAPCATTKIKSAKIAGIAGTESMIALNNVISPPTLFVAFVVLPDIWPVTAHPSAILMALYPWEEGPPPAPPGWVVGQVPSLVLLDLTRNMRVSWPSWVRVEPLVVVGMWPARIPW
jgi:hypothetical protein